MINNSDINSFTDRLNKLWVKQEKVLEAEHAQVNLIPLDDVYFHNNSKLQLIIFLQLIGIFILALAIINFIKLTIAKSVSRTREIGVRKVIGASRAELLKQFLGESIFICLLAMAAALMIIEVVKPYFVNIVEKPIKFDMLQQPQTILLLIAGIILIGIISGIFPAIIISAFKPVSILKNEITKGKRGNSLRYILIVFQFVISISLIICTIMVSKQMNFLKSKDIGLNNKNIIHFKQKYQINKHYDAFKQKLLENADIIHVSRSNTTFGQALPIEPTSMLHGHKKSYSATTVDPDFIPSVGIKILQGRQFSWDTRSDINKTAVVNETFVKEFELKQPLGAVIDFIDWKVSIIGVMKDFNYTSLHQKIKPTAIIYADWNGEVNIQISSHNISRTIQYIRDTWYKFSPDNPFEYEFLDETYGKLYKSDEQFQSIINCFSVIAIIIACLGLLGLVSINIDRRIKEIGIRKILGASINSIVYTITGEYLKWIALANIIAWPIAYYFMNKWLQNFAYHTEISWWVFVLAGGIALLIALATVSFQAIKAAAANPIESLRNE
jgi:putative ABC transport system permease protein